MSLKNWLRNRWLTEHTANREEISGLLTSIDQDMEACMQENLSPAWRLTIAYTAALRASTIALAASGYRAAREQYHFRSIHSLKYTVKAEPQLISELDQFRKKRNSMHYDNIQVISNHEAERMIDLAALLRNMIVNWLNETHPDLMV